MEKYPRITQAQFELWIANPVTEMFLQCLDWAQKDLIEITGKGGFVDSSNNDITCNKIHSALGEGQGLQVAANPRSLLERYQVLEIPKEEE